MWKRVSGMLIFIFLFGFFNAAAAEVNNEVHFLDTGQSDCILIKAGSKNYLIDTGTIGTAEKTINYLNAIGVKDIQEVIITHYHDDHYGGLKKILLSKNVSKVMLPRHKNELKEEIVESIKSLDVKIGYIDENYNIRGRGIELKALIPHREDDKIENNNSLVLQGSIDGLNYLFMADAELSREKELLKLNEISKCDIIKIGHHGFNTSTSEAFIEKAKPRVAVITCNGSESPNKGILSRIEKQGTVVLRTDTEGNIMIKSSTFNRDSNIKGIEIISHMMIK